MFTFDPLQPLTPRFFVSRLSEKPQNPILRQIQISQANRTIGVPPRPETEPSTNWQPLAEPASRERKARHLSAPSCPSPHLSFAQSQILSWNTVCNSQSEQGSPFLSEQSSTIVSTAAKMYGSFLRLPSSDVSSLVLSLNPTSQEGIHVTQFEFIHSLRVTLLGFNSPLLRWDATTDGYIQWSSMGPTTLFIDGTDGQISLSLIDRFSQVCSMIRRLDIHISTMRASPASGPIAFAYCYSVSTVLAHITNILLRQLSLETRGSLFSLWKDFETPCAILEEVDAMRHTVAGLSTTTGIDILSIIYASLQSAYSRQLPAFVKGTLAFTLSESSKPYLTTISRSLGMLRNAAKFGLDLDSATAEDQVDESRPTQWDRFPAFFNSNLVNNILSAQKSLRLLQEAKPDHPIISFDIDNNPVAWFWTREEIEDAWCDRPSGGSQDKEPLSPLKKDKSVPLSSHYRPELSGLGVFDLEPGSGVEMASLHKVSQGMVETLQTFILRFPEVLPSITPTLDDLSSLVFNPLLRRSRRLSTELLRLFLSQDSTTNLHFEMVLLRSYMLGCSPKFKARLGSALFSDDSEVFENAQTISGFRRQNHADAPHLLLHGRWPAGLAPDLRNRDTWPPSGADLSFYLRAAISGGDELPPELRVTGTAHLIRDAEGRIGFAIRDLPTEKGQNGWLNPCSTEALDFLCMVYRPPKALEVLLTMEVLSKYQRVFAFILRVMRVEYSIRGLFKMTRLPEAPLFPTLTSSNKLLMHFRFVSSAFLSTLSQYLSDTAIGANFDAFLQRLDSSVGEEAGFPDIFAIGVGHSAMLDRILSACLLRSSQRRAGDLLRQILEVMLDLAVVIGDVKRGRHSEFEGAQMLDKLYRNYRRKMMAFVDSLRTLIESNTMTTAQGRKDVSDASNEQQEPLDDSLQQFLLRIDFTGHYSSPH